MRSNHYRFREASEQDFLLIWRWTNHPLIRCQSLSADPIPLEEHLTWFQNPAITKLVFEVNGQPQGFVSRNLAGYWSFYISPQAQEGQGLGTAMLALALLEIDGPVKAHVLVSNKASNRLHEKMGFKLVNSVHGVNDYLLDR